MNTDYDFLPEHMRKGAMLYVEYGIEPGEFFRAVLENNLKEAFTRADFINEHKLADFVYWLIWKCPDNAQGSPEKVNAWIEAKKAKREGLGLVISPEELAACTHRSPWEDD